MNGSMSAEVRWTHPSVLRLAKSHDPVAYIEQLVRACVLRAIDEGWEGPPFNPFLLADKLGIMVEAQSDIPDARTVAHHQGVKIQFNPSRPRERVRFSIAHEIAHTFFPDVAEAVRNRGGSPAKDDWQLEMLCNIAAAEIIMPIGSLPIQDRMPPLKELMAEVRRFDVSTEAFLIRATKVTSEPIMMFCASTRQTKPRTYAFDYSMGSRGWTAQTTRDLSVPEDSVISECTAVGHTAFAEETWKNVGRMHVEAVGIPSFPGASYPRVAGFVRKASNQGAGDLKAGLKYVNGNVLTPQGSGKRLICQLVNDRARRWGGGVAAQSAKKFPRAENEFASWFSGLSTGARLGSVHVTDVAPKMSLLSLVAQAGIGQSSSPRLRYAALESCLQKVAQIALEAGATVHLPRIGVTAGGDWERVEQMLNEIIVSQGCSVIVYDLPPRRAGSEADLFG